MHTKKDFQNHIRNVEKMLDTLKDKREVLSRIDLPPGSKISIHFSKESKKEKLQKEKEKNDKAAEAQNPARKVSKLLSKNNSLLDVGDVQKSPTSSRCSSAEKRDVVQAQRREIRQNRSTEKRKKDLRNKTCTSFDLEQHNNKLHSYKMSRVPSKFKKDTSKLPRVSKSIDRRYGNVFITQNAKNFPTISVQKGILHSI